MQQQQTDRDRKGRFQAGNQVCYQGWQALVQKRFQGDEQACKAWWSAWGAYHSDFPYHGTSIQKFFPPPPPEEFLAQRRQALALRCASVPNQVAELPEMAF
jgi:hypothetical protein